jgi:siroheme synthase-like protein
VPELCDFFSPAVVSRGDLQIAIGTQGYYPAFAGRIRQMLEEIFTEQHGRFLAELETIRKKVLSEVPDAAQRKAILGKLVDDESMDIFMSHGPDAWRKYADEIISKEQLAVS